jgi:hypothetical protein
MALNLFALAGLVGFSQLIVLGIYFYRRGRLPRHGRFWRWPPAHDTVKTPVTALVQTKQTQEKVEMLKPLNGKVLLPDIAEKSLRFFNGKKEELTST